jgi:hypothetical protein
MTLRFPLAVLAALAVVAPYPALAEGCLDPASGTDLCALARFYAGQAQSLLPADIDGFGGVFTVQNVVAAGPGLEVAVVHSRTSAELQAYLTDTGSTLAEAQGKLSATVVSGVCGFPLASAFLVAGGSMTAALVTRDQAPITTISLTTCGGS